MDQINNKYLNHDLQILKNQNNKFICKSCNVILVIGKAFAYTTKYYEIYSYNNFWKYKNSGKSYKLTCNEQIIKNLLE